MRDIFIYLFNLFISMTHGCLFHDFSYYDSIYLLSLLLNYCKSVNGSSFILFLCPFYIPPPFVNFLLLFLLYFPSTFILSGYTRFPCSFYIFSAPVLELVISSMSLGLFYWKIISETKEWILDMHFASEKCLHLGFFS